MKHLATVAPHLNVGTVLSAGATEIRKVVSPEDLAIVIESYMKGIKGAFALLLAISALTVVLATLIPLKKLPSHETKKSEVGEATVDPEKPSS